MSLEKLLAENKGEWVDNVAKITKDGYIWKVAIRNGDSIELTSDGKRYLGIPREATNIVAEDPKPVENAVESKKQRGRKKAKQEQESEEVVEEVVEEHDSEAPLDLTGEDLISE